MMRAVPLALLGTLLLSAGCSRGTDETVLARVGDAVLTLEHARGIVGTEDSSEAWLRQFVSGWVEAELIHQEALHQGFERSDDVRRQIEDIDRQVIIQAFLEKEIYSDSTGISDAALREYFSRHAEEFPAREDIIQMNMIVLSSREQASIFAAAVAQGTFWNSALASIRADSIAAGNLSTGVYFTQRTLYPVELWKVALQLAMKEASVPVKTLRGYVVLQPMSSIRRGNAVPYELALDEVRQRMLVERSRKKYYELLGTLRQRYNVQIVLNAAQSPDTSITPAHE